jgi:peptide/nickel transport system ATP-binding protein/oligopeptide transport system ATP-binding protein
MNKFLNISDISKRFNKTSFLGNFKNNSIYALKDISLELNNGDSLGLVGESGSGKTTLGRILMALIKPDSGLIEINNTNLLNASKSEMKKFRSESRMIFQNLDAALNPSMKISTIIEEPLLLYTNLTKIERANKVSELLERVHLPKYICSEYPHSLSGGQKRRLSLARAIAIPPKFLVADEPLAALDVSVRGQIINLLKELKKEFNLTIVFISHDIGVLPELCNKVAVMYKGAIVEKLTIKELEQKQFTNDYTEKLISSVLTLPRLR